MAPCVDVRRSCASRDAASASTAAPTSLIDAIAGWRPASRALGLERATIARRSSRAADGASMPIGASIGRRSSEDIAIAALRGETAPRAATDARRKADAKPHEIHPVLAEGASRHRSRPLDGIAERADHASASRSKSVEDPAKALRAVPDRPRRLGRAAPECRPAARLHGRHRRRRRRCRSSAARRMRGPA